MLDIAGPALQPSEYVHLMLRKPDPRRQLTQTWRFIDGRLCCGHNNVFVQAKDGFYGLRQGITFSFQIKCYSQFNVFVRSTTQATHLMCGECVRILHFIDVSLLVFLLIYLTLVAC